MGSTFTRQLHSIQQHPKQKSRLKSSLLPAIHSIQNQQQKQKSNRKKIPTFKQACLPTSSPALLAASALAMLLNSFVPNPHLFPLEHITNYSTSSSKTPTTSSLLQSATQPIHRNSTLSSPNIPNPAPPLSNSTSTVPSRLRLQLQRCRNCCLRDLMLLLGMRA